MKPTMLFISLMATCLWSTAQQRQFARDKQIDDYIAAEMRETATPGMAVAVVKNGKVLHFNTYGIANAEHDIPVNEHTNFAIASTTKLITSTLVMKWVQEGKIALEDPVGKYIANAPGWKDIKIRHLLSHEGGIPWPSTLGGYLGIGSAENFKVESTQAVVEKLRDTALIFAPGTKQAYQNGDYFVLQYIIEMIGGAPIDILFKNEVFLPLGMNDGGFDGEYRGFPFQTMLPVKNKSQNFTSGFNGLQIFKAFYAPSSYGAGGMFLSLSDLVTWAIALDKQTMINKAIQQRAVKPTQNAGGFSVMGWAIQNNNGVEIAGHSGGPGLADLLRVPKDNMTVIVLTNNADLYAYMATNILKIYYPAILPEKMPKTFNRNLQR